MPLTTDMKSKRWLFTICVVLYVVKSIALVDLAQMCGLDGKSQCNGKAGLMSSDSSYAKDSHPHFLNDGNPNTYLFAVDGTNSLSSEDAHIEIDLGASRSIEKVVILAGGYDMTIQHAYIMVLDQAGCNTGSGTFRKGVDSSTAIWPDTTYTTDCRTTGRYICIQKCNTCIWEANSIGIAELQVFSLDVLCPAYSHAPAGSRSMGDCVCTAGYEGANGEECTECVSGKYMPSTGTRTCIACTQTSGCECKAGWYGQLGLDCTECPPRATSLPNSVDATSCFFVSTLATQACVVAKWASSDMCTSVAEPPNYSDDDDDTKEPRRIIDGDITTDFPVKKAGAWVTIDLLRDRMITGVRIVSMEKSGARDGVLVKVGTEDKCTGSVCVENAVLGTTRSTIMLCEVWGRYVCVENGNNYYELGLAELQVWALPVDTSCPDNSHTQAGASSWDLQNCVCDDGYFRLPGGAWCTWCNPGLPGCPSCAEIHQTTGRTHRDCLVVYMQEELFKNVQAGISVLAILVDLSNEVRALLSPGFSLRIESQPRSVNDVVLRRVAGTPSWYPANIKPTHRSTNAYRLVMPVAV